MGKYALQKLYDKVFEKAQKLGQLSPYSLSCEELMNLIRIAQAAQQSVQRTCPHVETFINPISGYVECMACGEPLHDANR